MRKLKAYRVVTGDLATEEEPEIVTTVFHMTFYAEDKNEVLAFLMVASECDSGVIVPASDITESVKRYSGPVISLAN